MLKEQIAEIHREANMFLGERGPDVLIDRELRAKADGVVVKNSECRRPNENLVSLGVCDGNARLQESVGTFAD